jgi:hypothetical protein
VGALTVFVALAFGGMMSSTIVPVSATTIAMMSTTPTTTATMTVAMVLIAIVAAVAVTATATAVAIVAALVIVGSVCTLGRAFAFPAFSTASICRLMVGVLNPDFDSVNRPDRVQEIFNRFDGAVYTWQL